MGDDELQLRFFRQRKAIRYPRPRDDAGRRIDSENVDGLIACVTSEAGRGGATLIELRTVYTLEDAMNMLEVIMVRRANEYLSAQEAERKAQQQR